MSNLRTNYAPGELIKSADFNDITTAINNLLNAQNTFATTSWVEGQQYLQEHLSLTDYATVSALADYTKTLDLADVATSGSYNDLEDVPELDLSMFELVETLPSGAEINLSKVYLTKDTELSTDELDVYKLNKYINGSWSVLGSYKTSIDLSGYVEKETGKGLFSGSYTDLTSKPDLSQYVTLSGNQTITGNKTFTNALQIQGDGHIQSTTNAGAIRLFGGTTLNNGAAFIFHGKDYNSDYWKGSFNILANNGTTYKELTGKPDGTLTWTGDTIFVKNSNNTGALRVDGGDSVVVSDTRVYIRPTNETNNYGNGHGVCFDFTDKDITPETTKEISLGEPNHQFNNIYGNTVYQNGKQVANAEDLNSYVTLATDLTISGSKTFSKDIILKSSTGTSQGAIRANSSDELIISDSKAIYFRNTNTPTATTENGFKLEFILGGTDYNTLRPETNEGLSLGRTGYQWDNIYGKTIYLNGKLVANKEDLNSYVKKSTLNTKEITFVKEDGSTETLKVVVEV